MPYGNNPNWTPGTPTMPSGSWVGGAHEGGGPPRMSQDQRDFEELFRQIMGLTAMDDRGMRQFREKMGMSHQSGGPSMSEFGALGGKGSAPRGMPSGNYTLAKYPGLDHELWKQERGFAGTGYGINPYSLTPKQTAAADRQRELFVNQQRKLLGMNTGNGGYQRRMERFKRKSGRR
jgi:hypothetical protein